MYTTTIFLIASTQFVLSNAITCYSCSTQTYASTNLPVFFGGVKPLGATAPPVNTQDSNCDEHPEIGILGGNTNTYSENCPSICFRFTTDVYTSPLDGRQVKEVVRGCADQMLQATSFPPASPQYDQSGITNVNGANVKYRLIFCNDKNVCNSAMPTRVSAIAMLMLMLVCMVFVIWNWSFMFIWQSVLLYRLFSCLHFQSYDNNSHDTLFVFYHIYCCHQLINASDILCLW